MLGVLGLSALVGCDRACAPRDENRGRALYQEGRLANAEPLKGRLGDGAAEIEGDVAACVRCHGRRAAGGREGAIAAPAISARDLFRPRSDGPTSRPAYTRRSLRAAITRGESPTGRALAPWMPRFELSEADFENLVAYLEHVVDDLDPGVSAETLLIGTSLPMSGPDASIGTDVRSVLEAYFADVNARGGIYRRALALEVDDLARVGETNESANARREALARRTFAIVAPSLDDEGLGLTAYERAGAVIVGPLGFPRTTEGREAGTTFFLYPGIDTEARALVRVLDGAGLVPLAILAADDELGRTFRSAAEAEARLRGVALASVVQAPPGTLASGDVRRAIDGAKAVLFSGTSSDAATLAAAQRASGRTMSAYGPPTMLDPVARTAVPNFRITYPALLDDRVGPGMEELLAFMARHGLSPKNLAYQAQAYATAQLVVDALKRSSANPTRETLLAALEETRDFDARVTPLLSFGPGRRIGVRGMFLAEPDAKRRLRRASEWILFD